MPGGWLTARVRGDAETKAAAARRDAFDAQLLRLALVTKVCVLVHHVMRSTMLILGGILSGIILTNSIDE